MCNKRLTLTTTNDNTLSSMTTTNFISIGRGLKMTKWWNLQGTLDISTSIADRNEAHSLINRAFSAAIFFWLSWSIVWCYLTIICFLQLVKYAVFQPLQIFAMIGIDSFISHMMNQIMWLFYIKTNTSFSVYLTTS